MSHRKIKIGFDAKRLFHNNTGLGNYARTLIKNLNRFYPEKYEIHLFSPSLVKNEQTAFVFETDIITHTAPYFANHALWRTWFCSKMINKLKLDIFHGLSHELPYGIDKSIIKVVSIHDLIYEKLPHLFTKFDALSYKFKYRSACRRADQVVAISTSTINDIHEIYPFASHKTKLIFQSINELFFKQSLPKLKASNYYLYVGSIIERKGLSNIVSAYSLLPEKYQLPLYVVGDGRHHKNFILKLIAEKGLTDQFIFKGNMQNDHLVQLYDNALCLILPSSYEGFGIPVAESLSRKTPVITSNVSSLPEVLGPGGIATDIDSHALKNAMIAMHEKELWQSYSSLGYEYVIANFSAEKTTRELDEFYSGLLMR